jgi:hypothetical protein
MASHKKTYRDSITNAVEGRSRCVVRVLLYRYRPCYGHRPVSASISVQTLWDLWWTKWHWDRYFSQHFSFPCQYHSTNAPNSQPSDLSTAPADIAVPALVPCFKRCVQLSYSVQNILLSFLQSKDACNTDTETINLLLLCVCWTCSLALREGHRLRAVIRHKREEVTGNWR